MSHVLPPFSIDSDRGSEESEEEEDSDEPKQSPINHATLSPPVRISNLIDFEVRRRSTTTTTTTTESPSSSFPEKYSHFQKRIYEYPRVNVSNKLGWTAPTDELHFVTSDSDKVSTSHVLPDRQPMSNKYQEESIEYLHGFAPGSTLHRPPHKPVSDRVEIPVDSSSEESDHQSDEPNTSEEFYRNRTTQEPPQDDKDRFQDFDDYEELHPGGSFSNVTVVKRRRRPGPPGRVTIVKVFPPRRHLRPTTDPGNEGGFPGFISFLKRMQDKFMQRTAKNIGDKIKILQELKDQLLLSIERKMSLLWRDRNGQTEGEQKTGNRRVKRGGGGWMDYGDGGHGGMDFPSAEAALLTISFLTFAVFLIKLVLQVINTIKSKHYTYNTLAGMNGLSGATLKVVNRSKRSTDTSADEHDHWKHNLDILSAINNYKFS
ncbi:AAEL015586-PA [Aedes aegypti]|uniref:AAEL015586-PA n=1 Tax=Aedes aegypti TaxID=7159 RepID=Q1DGL3_AEDAE|nr:AAEL015586-PA [Aedes aegypti]